MRTKIQAISERVESLSCLPGKWSPGFLFADEARNLRCPSTARLCIEPLPASSRTVKFIPGGTPVPSESRGASGAGRVTRTRALEAPHPEPLSASRPTHWPKARYRAFLEVGTRRSPAVGRRATDARPPGFQIPLRPLSQRAPLECRLRPPPHGASTGLSSQAPAISGLRFL